MASKNAYQDMFDHMYGGASPGEIFNDLAGTPIGAPPNVIDVPGTKLGNTQLWEMVYNTTGELPPNLKPAPETEEERANKRRKEEQEAYSKNARGRAATYLTGPMGLLENPALFKRSLLGT
jgi:hypothetical protein